MEQLAKEFESLGFQVDRSYAQHGVVVLKSFQIPIGRYVGKVVEIGVHGQDFPFTPPAGFHVNPPLVPNGANNISQSPLGGTWQYWSRRLSEWTTNRSAKHILSYIHKVLLDA